MTPEAGTQEVHFDLTQFGQSRIREDATPETDFNARFEFALGVQGQRLEHGDSKRRHPAEPDHLLLGPLTYPLVGKQEGRSQDVQFVVEIMRQDPQGTVRFSGNGPHGGARQAVAGDHAPRGLQDLTLTSLPVDDLGQATSLCSSSDTVPTLRWPPARLDPRR